MTKLSPSVSGYRLFLLLCYSFVVSSLLGQNTYTIQTDGETYRFGYGGGDDKYRDFTIPSNYDPNSSFNQITFALRGGDGGRRRIQGICTEPGGKGARVDVSFEIGFGEGKIEPGGTIRIIVGQQGGSLKSGGLAGAGGGGGSAVLYRPAALTGNGVCSEDIIGQFGSTTTAAPSINWDEDCWILLAVAGAGGGAYAPGGCAQASSGKPGNAGESGTDGKGNPGSGANNGRTGETDDLFGEGGSGWKPVRDGDGILYGGRLTGDEGDPNGLIDVRGGYGYGGGGAGKRGILFYSGGGGGGFSGGGGGGAADGGGGGGSFTNSFATFSDKRDGKGTDRTPNNGYVSYRFELNADIVDAPIAVCRDTTVTIIGELGSVSVADLAPESTDPNDRTLAYCVQIGNLGCVPNLSFNCGDIGDEQIYTVTVDNGILSSTCTSNIEIQQGVAGTLVCPDPEPVDVDDCGSAILSGFDVEIRDFPACEYTIDAYIQQPDGSIDTDFLLFDEDQGLVQEEFEYGTSLLVYTVTYDNGDAVEEVQSCVVTVTVLNEEDTVLECPDRVREFAEENECERLVSGNDLASGYVGCGTLTHTVTTSDINIPEFSGTGELTSFAFPVGTSIVTYTVNTPVEQVISCSFEVIIDASGGTSRPQIFDCQSGDVTVEIYEGITQEEILAQIDYEISDDCGIASVAITNLNLGCDRIGIRQANRVIEVTDTDGNTDNCSVNIVTQGAPAVITCPGNMFRVADQNDNTIAVFPSSILAPLELPTCFFELRHSIQDLNTLSVVTSGDGTLPTQLLGPGNYQVSYILELVEDGEIISCSFAIDVVDCAVAPVSCQDATVNLSELPANPADLLVVETEDCSLEYIASIDEVLGCDDVGVNTLLVTITDDFGNENTCGAVLNIIDDDIPEVTACPTDRTINLDVNCEASVPDLTGEIMGMSICSSVTPVQEPAAGTLITEPGIVEIGVNLLDEDGRGAATPCLVQITVADNTAPTPVCADVEVFLDQNGQGSIDITDVDNGSFDNCGEVSLSFDATLDVTQLNFECPDAEASSVTLYVTDEAGNQVNCMANTTIKDNLPPTAACIESLTIGLSESPLLATQVNDGSTDNCTDPENLSLFLLATDVGGAPLGTSYNLACGVVGNLNLTLDVRDEANNLSSCDVSVTVVDDIAPTAHCQDITVNMDSEPKSITADDIDNGSSDNCGSVILSLDRTDFGCADVGQMIEVTLSVGDGTNSSSCIGMVTVTDTTPPTATCGLGIVTLDENGEGTLLASDLNGFGGSTDACGPLLFSLDEAGIVTTMDYSCADIGQPDITLYITDANGNTTSCTTSVLIEDQSAPNIVCVTELTVGLSESSLLATQLDGGSSDNCTAPENLTLVMALRIDDTGDPANDFLFLGESYDLSCADVGTQTFLLSVSDEGGEGSTCQVVVTVVDDIPPTANCQDITVNIDNDPQAIAPDQVNNGSSDNCGSVMLSLDRTDFGCADVGQMVEVTLSVDDGSNSSTCTGSVTVTDNTSPFVDCQAGIVNLDTEGKGTLLASTLNDNNGSTDACGPLLFSFDEAGLITSLDFDCDDVGTLQDFVYATDANGNVSSPCPVTIFIRDEQVPAVSCQDITVELGDNGTASIVPSQIGTASDNCGINTETLDINTFDCTDAFFATQSTITVTYRTTDNNSNPSSCTAAVKVEDRLAPELICRNPTYNLTPDPSGIGFASLTITESDLLASFSDNCSATAFGADSSFEFGRCEDVGVHELLVNFTDEAGNEANCTSTVTITETVLPNALCQDVIVSLDALGKGVLSVNQVNNGSSDECLPLTLSFSPDAAVQELHYTCSEVDTEPQVNLYVTDNSGNTQACTASITIQDVISPKLGCPSDLQVNTDTGECGADVNLSSPSASDNCNTGDPQARYRKVDAVGNPLEVWSDWAPDPSGFFEVGSYEVQWNVKDQSGNEDFCAQQLEVVDEEFPELTCKDFTVSFNGEATLPIPTPSIFDTDASFDACGEVSFVSQSRTEVSCAEIGQIVAVEVVGVDPNGNSNTCNAYVKVIGMPCGFEATDVDCAEGADASYDSSNESFTLTANDCPGYPDGKSSFVGTSLCGDGEIIAHVADLDLNARAGVVMMENTDGGAKMVGIVKEVGRRVRTEYRSSPNANVSSRSKTRSGVNWLRIVRSGNQFKTYTSTNGSFWRLAHRITFPSFAECIQVGIYVYSKSSSQPISAVFDQVEIIRSDSNPLATGTSEFSTLSILKEKVPSDVTLTAAPNPFSIETKITFTLEEQAATHLNIFNLQGQRIKSWPLGELDKGEYQQVWDGTANGKALAAGLYFIQVQHGDKSITKRVILQSN